MLKVLWRILKAGLITIRTLLLIICGLILVVLIMVGISLLLYKFEFFFNVVAIVTIIAAALIVLIAVFMEAYDKVKENEKDDK